MLTSFSNEKIISLLETHSLWSKRACREILKRKDDFIPLLIGILDEAADDPWQFISSEKKSHIPAAMLLAQMRVREAYSRLVSLISFDEVDLSCLWYDLITDLLTGHYAWMLRDTFNGEAFLLPRLIEDRSLSAWARTIAIHAWSMHYFDGYVSREEITGCFRHLIHNVYTGKLDRDDEGVLGSIVDCIRDHKLEELIDDVKSIYERTDSDNFLYGDSDSYAKALSNPAWKVEDLHIENAIQELEKCGWFDEEKFKDREKKPEPAGDDESGQELQQQELAQQKSPQQTVPQQEYNFGKVGRNEPCPCGRGRKYKNCCLGRK